MGILNVTPDSFSDGGQYRAFAAACRHADEMIAAGAHFIDIGGESTRPGAADVSVAEELQRVVPMVEYIAANSDVWISVDTSKPEVMAASVAAGAHLINDIRSLTEPGALETAVELQVPVCIMHMQGQPRTMQAAPQYQNLLAEVSDYFAQQIARCTDAGLARERLLLDPGFGFGKTLEHNYRLLAHLQDFAKFELPLLIGLSRKSMIGNLLQRPVSERLAGSLSGALLAAMQGAHIIRVHDVPETLDVLQVLAATQAAN
ncbi:dihydropteroate synthase [Shewanella dokdonensis]|uniref:dihydropteroate synthase n=1 Tax=Shewanella dokdonensis TaxID=712036 RepID=A0ABX8DJM7_9GAMM|nr:dihydropteroate synthase [Shewanella dokdonensis]MCL1074206.1 dihydropteroate synthase [Shewanella dokdonensis]QVK24744.1 dihydropteroate synthase [Shewanella dokdonensis]